jgi:hypothetical protein
MLVDRVLRVLLRGDDPARLGILVEDLPGLELSTESYDMLKREYSVLFRARSKLSL